jgi:hypothetical protein
MVKVKICNICKIEKSIEDFNKDYRKKANDGVSYRCKECNKKYRKEYYLRNKRKCLDINKKTKKRNYNFVKEYKKGKKCIRCGESDVSCLTFHHRDSDDKDFTISTSYRNRGINVIKKEIEKCDILCANCHAKLHFSKTYAPIA